MVRRKNRLTTDAVREVRATLGRFLSILVLAALSVAFLAGLRTTAPDMEYTADNYYDRTHLMDGYVVSTLGLTDDDLLALSQAEGIDQVEGSYSLDATAVDAVVTVRSMPQTLNLLEVVEGRLPQAADECVTESLLLTKLELSVGDTLTLTLDEGNEGDLKRTEYTIVGVVDSPLYVGTDRGSSTLGNGSVDAFVYIPGENFNLDYYVNAYFTVEGLAELDSYGDQYEELLDAQLDSMDALAEERAQLRHDTLVGDAQAELDDARRELEDARAEAEAELADAEQELADARQELDDGWAEYYDGWDTLNQEVSDAEQELADAEQTLADAYVELTDGEAEYQDGLAALEEGEEAYADGLREWQEGRQELDDGWAEYYDGLAEYEDGLAELEDAERALDDGWAELEDAEQELNDGWAELRAGRRELDAGWEQYEAQLPGAQAQLEEYRNQLAQAQAGLPQAQAGLEQAQAGLAAAQSYLDSLTPPGEDATQEEIEAYATAQAAVESAQDYVTQAEAQVTQLETAIEQLTAGIATGEKALEDALEQLQDGEAEYAAGLQEYKQGEAQYEAGLKEYEQGKADLEAGKQELADAKEQLDEALAELENGEAELADGWAELEEARQEIEDSRQKLADARQELDDGWAEYEQGLIDLENGRQELADKTAEAKAELADAYIELTDGEAEYADGLADYEEGKAEADAEIADAEKKLDDAQDEVDDIEECEWYVLGRDTNAGVVGYAQDAERVSNLAAIFPVIFFLVAALACLTTMTRMVEDQRTQIGALKALGFSRLAISKKYLGYAFWASFIGGILGLALGCTVIPLVIANAFNIMYNIPSLQFKLQPVVCVLAVLAAVVCTTGAALWACLSTLIDTPANLMRPKSPKPGKRVFLEYIRPLWRRLSFTWKVTMRNLFRYRRRFWMTVIGIGGCTALIVTGFGLHDSIFSILDKQFDEISQYDATVGLDDRVSGEEMDAIRGYLDDATAVERYLECYQSTADASTQGSAAKSSYLFVVEDLDVFTQFIDLRHRTDEQEVTLTDDGVVITEKLSEMLEVQIGDTIILEQDGQRVQAQVSDVVENYVYHYVYMTESCYENLFGERAEMNTILVAYTDEAGTAESDTISSDLMRMDGVASYSYIATIRDSFTDSMNAINYAVIIIILAAAALAFVVLYNLTNINITERIRELATLKVLGFYDGEVTAYVYRENIFLTLFGILLGLVLGRFLHAWMVVTVEVDLVMFGRTAPPYAYVLAAVLTIVFSVMVNIAAHFKLKKVDVVESLKSVE